MKMFGCVYVVVVNTQDSLERYWAFFEKMVSIKPVFQPKIHTRKFSLVYFKINSRFGQKSHIHPKFVVIIFEKLRAPSEGKILKPRFKFKVCTTYNITMSISALYRWKSVEGLQLAKLREEENPISSELCPSSATSLILTNSIPRVM